MVSIGLDAFYMRITPLEDLKLALAKEKGNHNCKVMDNDVYVREDDSAI